MTKPLMRQELVDEHNLGIVAVQKLGKIFLLFSPNSIYIYGEEKEIKKFKKSQKLLL